jgi:predicted aspartyl protease
MRLLADEVYLYRGQYHRYVALADSIGEKFQHYDFAQLMSAQPLMQAVLTDSLHQPFRLIKHGHSVVTLLVNGRPNRFIVDSGAQRTTLSTKLAAELKLPKLVDYQLTNSLGQSLPSSIHMLDSFQLGTLHVSHLPVMTQSLWADGADGLLGWDVLRQMELVIDYATRTLTLRQPPRQPRSTVRNLLGGSRPMVVVQNGSTNYLTLFLDTGSDELVELTPAGQAKLIDGRPGHFLDVRLGVGGRVRIRRQKAVKQVAVRTDGYMRTVRKLSVERPNEQIEGVLIDGIVGSGFFRNGRLLLDPISYYFEFSTKS